MYGNSMAKHIAYLGFKFSHSHLLVTDVTLPSQDLLSVTKCVILLIGDAAWILCVKEAKHVIWIVNVRVSSNGDGNSSFTSHASCLKVEPTLSLTSYITMCPSEVVAKTIVASELTMMRVIAFKLHLWV